jgi:hypothetical protein
VGAKIKKQMQLHNFASVEEFFEFLEGDERQICLRLRNIILDCLPQAEEYLAYNVPYYRKRKTICFMWPASVGWGSKVTYEGVRLGFTHGHFLLDEVGYLHKGDRKQVYWRDIRSMAEINEELIRAYLYEALLLDEHS